MILIIFITTILSFSITNFFKKKQILIDDIKISRHKKFSGNVNVPACGGLILLIINLFFFDIDNKEITLKIFFILIFLLGLASDLNKIYKPKVRLIIQIIIVILFIKTFNLYIHDLRVNILNHFLTNNYFSLFFVSFCFLVILNGSNFIDGTNGNLIIYYLIVLISILFLAYINQIAISKNFFLIAIVLSIMLIFNSVGKFFMGDSGSYFLSFIIGYLIIELYNHQFIISPYFFAVLLWYPAFENLFTIIRRLKYNTNIHEPDTNHLHQLIFNALKKVLKKENVNNLYASISINIFNLVIFLIAIFYATFTKYQVIILIFNIFVYFTLYVLLSKYLKK